MKIVLGGFHQEINTFTPGKTTYEWFKIKQAIYGDEMIDTLENYMRINESTDAVAAADKLVKEAGGEVIPAGFLTAQSGPVIEQKVVDDYLEYLLGVIRSAGKVDGLFLNFHGASQSENCEDPEGYMLEAVRKEVGPDVIISVSLDFHADVTPKMVENSNFICTYQQYPHVDMYETGLRSAELGLKAIRGEIKSHMALVNIPMIIPASSYTTETMPLSALMDEGRAHVAAGDLLDFSLCQMQPWLDVSVGGSSIVAIGEDKEKAESIAKEMAAKLYGMRHQFQSNLTSIDDIITIAENNKTGKPVVLNDFADASGAGAGGDNADVLGRIIERKSNVRALMYVNDLPAVLLCYKLGPGSEIETTVGGTIDSRLATPIKFKGKIKAVYDGIMYFSKGAYINNGRSAVVEVGNTTVVITENHKMNGDTRLYTGYGYNPEDFDLIVVKACTSFRAFYPESKYLIYQADTRGAATSNLLSLPFERVPRTFYPFRDVDDFVPKVDAWGR